MGPQISFCRLPSGGQVAWAAAGEGPPIVMVPGWLCHVQELWTHPAAKSARDKLSARNRFIWYDRLGCGLSDRDGIEPSLENDVQQLETVLDAAGIEKATLIGYSFGGPPAAVFAARFPERVDRVVFLSSFARGGNLATAEAHDALKKLIAADWGLGSRTFASIFLPNGSGYDLRWFSRFQRQAATAEMAIRLLDHLRSLDVREALSTIKVPVLVLGNRRDPAVSPKNAQEIAALAPGASLHLLEGNEHEPFIRDSGDVVEAILDFVEGRQPGTPRSPEKPTAELTRREREVLRLIALGESNKSIAANLRIEVGTVERHVANIYGKVGARGRADAARQAIALGLVSARTG
ncbi:MAG TPA: alpha/beta fold hydrolase [Tepidiformaceae bacterium]